MHIKKVNKILKKINNLHQSILDDDDAISKIEKELLLSYIKNLFDEVIDGDDGFGELISTKTKSKGKKSNTKTKEIEVQELVVEFPEIKENPILEELIEDKTMPIDNVIQAVVMEEKEEVIVQKIDNTKILNEEIVEPITVIEVDPIPDVYSIPSEMDSLFEKIEIKELSAKLANAPIKSIKSKLGINEKLLTVKELFSKNQEQFNIVITHLDSLNSYEDASLYLAENIVDQFDWLSEKKFKKAVRFVQLVQRRYI